MLLNPAYATVYQEWWTITYYCLEWYSQISLFQVEDKNIVIVFVAWNSKSLGLMYVHQSPLRLAHWKRMFSVSSLVANHAEELLEEQKLICRYIF